MANRPPFHHEWLSQDLYQEIFMSAPNSNDNQIADDQVHQEIEVINENDNISISDDSSIDYESSSESYTYVEQTLEDLLGKQIEIYKARKNAIDAYAYDKCSLITSFAET